MTNEGKVLDLRNKKLGKQILKDFRLPTILILLAIILNFLYRSFPKFYEVTYEYGLYRLIRNVYDYAIGIWLPIPMIWLVLGGILYWVFLKKRKFNNLIYRLSFLVSRSLTVLTMFYYLWGFHYTQPLLKTQLGFDIQNVDSLKLYNEADRVMMKINEVRSALQNDTFELDYTITNKIQFENQVRDELAEVLDEIDWPTWGRPRIRTLAPKGILLRIKTAGVYFPFAIEGHIDKGLHHTEWPYTMSHEMSHAFGITDEGECNFTAYLACMQSKDMNFQYSALIDYSLYLFRDVYKLNPKKYWSYQRDIHKGYKKDIQAIRKNNALYPDILPKLRDFLYDSYLKSHGVKAGLKSYSQIVQYVLEYQEKYEIIGD